MRRAREGERLATLDDVERTLTAADLLICDGDDVPVGIAGVMGGATTEIDDATTDVLLEMAWFHPIGIVKSSRRHELRSEASARFEKGTDPEVIDLAMRRFAELLAPTGARLTDGRVAVDGDLPGPARRSGCAPPGWRPCSAPTSAPHRIAEVLEPIGFAATPVGDDLDVAIPSWRYDSATEIDVIEEIARHHGYTALGRTVPSRRTPAGSRPGSTTGARCVAALVGLGLAEAMPLPFLAPGELTRCGLPDDGITIANPLVAEESVLRTSLLPGPRRRGRLQLGPPQPRRRPLRDRPRVPAAPGSGRRAARRARGPRRGPRRARGRRGRAPVAGRWPRRSGSRARQLENAAVAGLHPTRAAVLRHDGASVGHLGEIDPGVLDAHGIGERVA